MFVLHFLVSLNIKCLFKKVFRTLFKMISFLFEKHNPLELKMTNKPVLVGIVQTRPRFDRKSRIDWEWIWVWAWGIRNFFNWIWAWV